MLKTLTIQNFVLIDKLELSPEGNFVVITGETGSGKSIILGGLNLLLGERADIKSLGNMESKCIIEGIFDIKDYNLVDLFKENDIDYLDETIIRREILPSGKSRAFVNDTPVKLDVLRGLTQNLIDIHSQHDTFLISQSQFQLKLIDSIANNEKLLIEYQKEYSTLKELKSRYLDLINQKDKDQSEFAYKESLLRELEEASLDNVDLPTLESSLKQVENAEHIINSLKESSFLLSENEEYSIEQLLNTILSHLSSLEGFGDAFVKLREQLESVIFEIQDISKSIEDEGNKVVSNPEEAQYFKEQLDKIYDLQRKHKVDDIDSLIKLREELRKEVDNVLFYDEHIKELADKIESSKNKALKVAIEISSKRKLTVKQFSPKALEILSQIGLPNCQFEIALEEAEMSNSGIDNIKFLFSANKGHSLKPIQQVASGGEFSRLMLAIKYILASSTQMPTLIFDEIDTGVSGEIALKMAKILKKFSKQHQLFVISHLPQIAAASDDHYLVLKKTLSHKSISEIQKLDSTQKTLQLGKMIGGENPSNNVLKSAKELTSLFN